MDFSFVIKCLRTFLHTDYRCLRIASLPLGVWGHLSSQRPRTVGLAREGASLQSLDPSPFPVTASYPQQRSSLVLRGPWFSSHSPAILPQDNGVSMRVSYILLLGKWSRVAWAEAYEGWESHPHSGGRRRVIWLGEKWVCREGRLVALRAFHDHYGAPCLDLPSKEDSLSSVRASHYPFGVENENKADTEAAMSSVGGSSFSIPFPAFV